MNWEDNCYLLSKRKFRENANIVNIFTEKKVAAYLNMYPSKPKEVICDYLQNSRDMLSSLKEKLLNLIEISNCKTVKELKGVLNWHK